ncbi:hypothetical protein RvY_10851 [Ramazzottius varieornatus]|uniref:HTH psq-type domain-containing protein n=1 Tax=Ramazzottius varieornatus TaxID=947166 RepID=A0A1D1VE45_RAMVA|nr:hypothetical protein RvY_10851 [Ramazzottius varieornatus]
MSESFNSKKRRKYTEESLKDAVRAVANGMSARFCFNRKRTQLAEPLFRKPLAKTFVHAKT